MADLLPFDVQSSSAGLVSAGLLVWVAAVYLVMAFGVRSGDLVWSGRHIGRLPAEQRLWSFVYAFALVGSAVVILEITGAVDLTWVPSEWLAPAGFVVTCLLGIAALLCVIRGSRWERMFFFPITLLGAGLAAYLTFA
jgi:hypothetical protein